MFPTADRFGDLEGSPPVYRAFLTDSITGDERLLGFVFHTADIPPETTGYNAPIRVLIGMDLTGTLTGIRVTSYRESLRSSRGDFLARPGIQAQFGGKSIGDAFRVRQDVETVTGATITVSAMAVGIRNAARRVAAAYLVSAASAETGAPPRMGTIPLEELSRLTWPEMVRHDLVGEITADVGRPEMLRVSIVYLRDEAVAEAMLGSARFPGAIRQARERSADGHLIFVGLNGPDILFFQPETISLLQEGEEIALAREDFITTGLLGSDARAGGEFRRTFLLTVAREALDPTRPFTAVVTLADGSTASTAYQAYDDPPPERPVPIAESGDAGAPAEGGVPSATAEPPASDLDALPSSSAPAPPTATASPALRISEQTLAELLAEQEMVEETVLERTLARTSWTRVLGLLVLLGLTLWSFFSKRATLRWVTLAATLGFLGLLDRGFLSVSHILAAITGGPTVYLEDVSLLIIASFTVVTTLVWGRMFCGYLCPFGALQDFLERLVPKRFRRELPREVHEKALWAKYGVLALVLAPALLGLSFTVYHYFEPFGTVFYWSPSVLLWAIAAVLLAASAVVPRFYCRYVCPLGAALAIGSLLAPFRIRRVEQCTVCTVCERRCPTGAIRGPAIDFKECVRCNDCEIQLIRKAGVCRHDMDVVRPRLVQIRSRVPSPRS